MVRNFPVRPWSSQGDTFTSVTANQVSAFHWFIATCLCSAILYGLLNSESVGAWTTSLVSLGFILGASFIGDGGKALILNHEY